MRCVYLSDLHLESETFDARLPRGDILIIAGDLCHARCLDPTRTDLYSVNQRGRVHRFIDRAAASFPHILLIAGNHEHYDGIFEETAGLLRQQLPGVIVLDSEAVEIGGVQFFGTTLWTDFNGGSRAAMDAVRRRVGEFFFVKTCRSDADGNETLSKFQPEDARDAHRRAWSSLATAVTNAKGRSTVVITHHPPSLQGLDPRFEGNGLDPAYASDRDRDVAALENVPYWIHGHTHVVKRYQIGPTMVVSNARGFVSKGGGTPGFKLRTLDI